MSYTPPLGSTIPPGFMMMFGSPIIPDGWLICQGQAISRLTYNNLFLAIGTTYGIGDNSTTFNLPDARGRVLLCSGNGHSIGIKGGEENHTLTFYEIPPHIHTIHSQGSDQGEGLPYPGGFPNGYPSDDNTTDTGGNLGHNNMQPFLVINGYIIKY